MRPGGGGSKGALVVDKYRIHDLVFTGARHLNMFQDQLLCCGLDSRPALALSSDFAHPP